MKIKKIIALGVGAIMVAGAFSGCTPVPNYQGQDIKTNEQIINLVDNAYAQGQSSVDVDGAVAQALEGKYTQEEIDSAVNVAIKAQEDADKQIMADYEEELAKFKQEKETTDIKNAGYEFEKIYLNTNYIHRKWKAN